MPRRLEAVVAVGEGTQNIEIMNLYYFPSDQHILTLKNKYSSYKETHANS